MKLYLFLLICFIGLTQATNSYAQIALVNLDVRNQTVKEVLNEIENQSDFSFFFNNRHVDLHRKVSFTVQKSDIFKVLDTIFAGTDVSYSVLGKKIILSVATKLSQPTKGSKRITGVVKDVQGEPVIGANVVEKGTTNGVITDLDGRFIVDVNENNTLQITYIGFLMQEVSTKDKSVLNITLNDDTQTLDEVVVIGYGTTKRKDFTGSVTSVKLENSPVALATNLNALEALKGRVSGLDVGAVNSAGGSPSMMIRGQNSISGSNDPLVVVDGVIFMGSLNDINPNDIASYDVLKDATSAAAYGSRSANGVIIITTKKGRSGKPVINFNASGSVQSWHLRPELMDGAQWIDAVAAHNKYNDLSFMTEQELINHDAGKERNWLDETTRTGWIQDYQVAVSGAGEKMNYYMSAAYTENKGVVKGDDFDRLTVFGKISTDITNWLQIGADVAYTRSDYSGLGVNLGVATILSPYDMMYRNEEQQLLERYPNGKNMTINPLWGIYDDQKSENIDIRDNFRTNAFAEIKPSFLPGLSYRLNYAATLENRRGGSFYHESYYTTVGPYDDESRYSPSAQKKFLTNASGNIDITRTNSWVLDNILKYNNTFGKHTVDLTAVATRDSKVYDYRQDSGSDFLANGNTALGLSGLHYAKVQKFKYDKNIRKNVGYLGRASYSYDDTYYVTGSFRRDGASVFGRNNKWGNFVAVGGAWRISNEAFLQSFSPLTDLKLKLSWGKNGNQGLEPYGTLSKVVNGSTGHIYYGFGNMSLPSYGINQSTIGNADLGWEKTEAWNVGFESAWLNSRLFVDVDVYFSKTSDQIFTRSIPVMTGFSSISSSMGEVANKGVEIAIRSSNIQNKKWSWNTSLTFWLNRNKLVHLYGDDLNGDGKEDDDIGNKLFIGESIHSIYGYKQNGIVQTDDEEYMHTNGVPAGSPKYVDFNNDGVINADDRFIIGHTDPNFKLNMSNTLSYKEWELYVMITGTFGGGGYFQQSNKAAFMTSGGTDQFAANSLYVPYWTPENRSNTYPGATYVGDDYFLGLQNRAYVRVQDVTLSYTFASQWVKKVMFNNLKLFVTAKNLATITGWKGGDPETGSTVQSGSYPVLSSFSLGVHVSF